MTIVGNVPWYVLLRSGSYKYVRYLVPGEMEELYDLDTDPDELVNLALVDRHRDLVRRLRREAIAELKRTDAGFVSSMPPVSTQ